MSIFFHQKNFNGLVGSYTVSFLNNLVEDADWFAHLSPSGSRDGDVFSRSGRQSV